MNDKLDISTIEIPLRAQLFRGAYLRVVNILSIYCEGYLIVFSEQLDLSFITLIKLCKEILNSSDFEELRSEFPHEMPESLFDWGDEADMNWDVFSPAIRSYIGKINQFYVQCGTAYDKEFEKGFFEGHDALITNFRKIKLERENRFFNSAEEKAKTSNGLFPIRIVQKTRGYIESIAIQANGCYYEGWYDACAVMIRRLIETLIIECFESYEIDNKIKSSDGNFLSLEGLIEKFISDPSWNLGRDTKRHLTKLPIIKGIGDHSAHNRRFIAHKDDIDKYAPDIRVVIQELVTIAFEKEKTNRGDKGIE